MEGRVKFNISLPEEMLVQLDQACKEEFRSRSSMIQKLLIDYLKQDKK